MATHYAVQTRVFGNAVQKVKSLAWAFAMLGLWSCTQTPPPEPTSPGLQTDICETGSLTLDADFSGGGMVGCRIVDEHTIEVALKPEDRPINASPWYAVRLSPKEAVEANIVLLYEEHPHRYEPKTSPDGVFWTPLPASAVESEADGYRVTIRLKIEDRPLLLTAQEVFTNEAYDDWVAQATDKPFLSSEVFGESIEGRALTVLRSSAAETQDRKTVMLVGRQHPPEVTGALAMISFMDEVTNDSELSQTFRERFNLVMIPNLNPDGVERGHWRHNLGGLDLNRDWGPFTQVETQAVKRLVDEIGDEMTLFLDFHSTSHNTFYTQPEGTDGTDYDFTATWLSRARARIPDYEFAIQGSHQLDLPTSKTYIHERFNIPAITYELGDETDRAMIDESAKVFAQEMMTLLLEEE